MLRKFFSCCLVLFFVPIVLATMLLFGLHASVFKAGFYQKAVEKTNLYDQLVDNILPALMKSNSSSNGSNALGPISQEDLLKIVKQALPKNWVYAQFKIISSATFAYIKGKTNSIDLKISLTDAKKILAQKLTDLGGQGQTASPQEITQTLSSIPDQLDLGAQMMHNPSVESLRQGYKIILIVTWVCFALSLLLLIIIGLINRFYPPGMLKWLAIPIMVPSALLFLIILTSQLGILFFLQNVISTNLEATYRPLAQDGIKYLVNPIFSTIEWETGIIFIVSLAVLIFAAVLTRKFPPPKKPEEIKNPKKEEV